MEWKRMHLAARRIMGFVARSPLGRHFDRPSAGYLSFAFLKLVFAFERFQPNSTWLLQSNQIDDIPLGNSERKATLQLQDEKLTV